MDAYAQFSVKSAHGKFGLHCVKAACLILRDPLFCRKKDGYERSDAQGRSNGSQQRS